MKKMQSLTTRLVVYLLFAQLVGAFLPWPVVAYIASVAERYGGADAMLEIYTYFHIQDLVANSLETSPDGAVRLAPTIRLKLRADQDADVRYAAMAASSTEFVGRDPPQSSIRSSSRRKTPTRASSAFIRRLVPTPENGAS